MTIEMIDGYPVGGWLIDKENRNELRATAGVMPQMAYSAPEEIDPRKWGHAPPIENQGQQGACQGHSLSSVVEYCHYVATQDYQQFSRAFAYYVTQKIDGIRGDQGSTIQGGVKCAEEYGLPLEEFCRYPSSYNPNVVTQEAYDKAKAFRIQKHYWLDSYQKVFDFLASGQGAVHTGIVWNNSMTPQNGVIENYRPGGGGGHAIPYLGYSKRKDQQGRNYLLLFNSWGTQWGNGGVAEVAPRAIESMLMDRWTVFVGLSDLTVPVVRPLDWIANSIFRS